LASGTPTDKITYIPNGVELERFSPGVNRGMSANFLFVGRLVAQKGLEYLVRASALLKKKGLEFSVDIVGDGPLNEDTRKLVHELGVEDRVRFLGYVSDDALPRIYSEADIFVLPSVWEGLPLTLLEAWASELPVIATNVGGIGDVCVNTENALVVPSGDVEAFAEAMERLISDISLRKKLGKNGRELVESGYTWKRVAERTMEVYEQLLSRE
jgi:glycosyltransferase involved in cell wall biosynthesis